MGIAASATSPTVYIGENNQTAGVITFKEAAAGFFTDGLGTANNTFAICPSGVGYSFTLAPVATVTGGVAAGNIILRDGAAASTTNIVVGTQDHRQRLLSVDRLDREHDRVDDRHRRCAERGDRRADQRHQRPGARRRQRGPEHRHRPTSSTETLAATVQFATAMYRNQVAVTALSAPYIAPGSTGPAGNVQIAETGLGQLKAGERICFEILWQAGTPQNTFMNSNDTADLPVATASGTGLVIGPVTPSCEGCTTQTTNPAVPAAYMESFSFTVLQQSTAGDGKVVVSNLRDTVLTGATLGPVQLSVNGFDVGNVGGTQHGLPLHRHQRQHRDRPGGCCGHDCRHRARRHQDWPLHGLHQGGQAGQVRHLEVPGWLCPGRQVPLDLGRHEELRWKVERLHAPDWPDG